jgi:hypothetical protein
LNFTPTSTAEVSATAGFAGVADDAQIVQDEQFDAKGVTALEAPEAGPVPTALVAVTLNV